jgi:hypothetical protein
MIEFLEHSLVVGVGFVVGSVFMKTLELSYKQTVRFVKYLKKMDKEG